MKRLLVSLFLFGTLLAGASRGDARSVAGFGDTADNYDCAVCYFIGGWGPYPVMATCHQTKSGVGGECYIENNQCRFRSGCVSLPSGIGSASILGLAL